MSYAQPGHGPLDYRPWSWPGSPMRFRGPKVAANGPFTLCIGGSETYGKFVGDPFPALLAARLDRAVLNMGAVNAGVDLFLHDPAITDALGKAEAVVLQVPGTQNMSNRFYTVHPRRNDRFVKASPLLQTIYRDVDFTEFHYTRHMLNRLRQVSSERFSIVVDELRAAWRARMAQLLDRIEAPVHLLWLSHRGPEAPDAETPLGADPLFVSRGMIGDLAESAASLSVVIIPRPDRPPATRGLFFARGEEAAARLMPGPDTHEKVAGKLAALLAPGAGQS